MSNDSPRSTERAFWAQEDVVAATRRFRNDCTFLLLMMMMMTMQPASGPVICFQTQLGVFMGTATTLRRFKSSHANTQTIN
jgi:hypothetical protein